MQVLNTLIVVCTKYRKPQGPSIHTSILNPAVPQNQVFLEMPLDDRLKYIVKAAVSVLPGSFSLSFNPFPFRPLFSVHFLPCFEFARLCRSNDGH